MFFDSYIKICEAHGVAPTTVLTEIGISKSAYGGWKNGGEPSNRTKKQIADYFGITVESLKNGEIKKAPTIAAEASDEMSDLLENIRRKPGMRTLFSLSKNATPEQLELYIDVIDE